MSLRLSKIPDRTPAKLTILLDSDILAALNDYAEIYEAAYGKREKIEQLAPEMIEIFLNSDGAFKRARKELQQRKKEA